MKGYPTYSEITRTCGRFRCLLARICAWK